MLAGGPFPRYLRMKAFEAALGPEQAKLQDQTLWYRMVAGGTTPRYVRLRPRPSLAALLDAKSDSALPEKVNALIAKTTVEILSLRPAMSLGLAPAVQRGRTDRASGLPIRRQVVTFRDDLHGASVTLPCVPPSALRFCSPSLLPLLRRLRRTGCRSFHPQTFTSASERLPPFRFT
jgi:hypothetical protein